MTQYRVIAAVTRTLTNLLAKRMQEPPGTINSLPPDVQVKDPPGPRRVNLFLYRVVENPYLKNQDRASPPGSYGRPPLSLDLHYLLTAYGGSDEDSKGAQEILGDAMAVLHDHPLIHPKDPGYDDVRDLGLDDAVEQVKVGLEPITTEDLTKVWTALTVPYRLSASYVVSVVQVQTRRPVARAPPVRDGARHPQGDPAKEEGRRIRVAAFGPPALDAVLVRRKGDTGQDPLRVPYAAIGDRLVLEGHGFGTAGAVVHVGGLAISALEEATPTRLVAKLPDDAALQPGPLAVHVAVPSPDGAGSPLTSNRRPVLLVPYVAAAARTTAQVPDEAWEPPPDDPGAARPDVTVPAVKVTGTRLVRAGVPCRAIVGGKAVPGERYLDAAEDAITVPLPPGMDPVGASVRILVDGHENLPRPGLEVAP